MKVVIVTAVDKEVSLIKEAIDSDLKFNSIKSDVSFLQSGIGILTACFSITRLIFEQRPDLIIQAGIAGAFDNMLPLGAVVVVKEEIIADAGVQENGRFKDLFEMRLLDPNSFPFSNKKLNNPGIDKLNLLRLPEVTGITVNEISTSLERIEQYRSKYNPVIESMEGASLHYCCLQTSVSFIQIRAVSNYIGERNKSNWNFQNAFKNLSDSVLLYLHQLYQMNQ